MRRRLPKPQPERRAAARQAWTLCGDGGERTTPPEQLALLWVLNLADGEHSLLDTGGPADLPFRNIRAVADPLVRTDPLESTDGGR